MPGVYTQKGEEVVTDLETAPTWYIGLGTGSTAPDKADTDLATPASEARVAATASQPSADVAQWVASIVANGAKTFKEAGLFDAAGFGSPPSGGNLIARGIITDAVVVSGDQVNVTVQLEQT